MMNLHWKAMTNSQLSFLPPDLPEGLSYVPDYQTSEQAQALVSELDRQVWRCDLKRRVQHYGYRYDYKARRARQQDFLGPLPDWLLEIASKLHSDGHFSNLPDQVIINEYLPGQGIAAHVDCVPCFGGKIGSISLLSGCVMRFAQVGSKRIVDQYLEPQSLVLMQGASRYDWTHGIAARKSDVVGGQRVPRGRRVSLTFRVMEL